MKAEGIRFYSSFILHFNVKRYAVMSRASSGLTPRFGMALAGSKACGFCSHVMMFCGVFCTLPAMNVRDASLSSGGPIAPFGPSIPGIA